MRFLLVFLLAFVLASHLAVVPSRVVGDRGAVAVAALEPGCCDYCAGVPCAVQRCDGCDAQPATVSPPATGPIAREEEF
jgi:hypothetical protein